MNRNCESMLQLMNHHSNIQENNCVTVDQYTGKAQHYYPGVNPVKQQVDYKDHK
jgi:hypothetical protein